MPALDGAPAESYEHASIQRTPLDEGAAGSSECSFQSCQKLSRFRKHARRSEASCGAINPVAQDLVFAESNCNICPPLPSTMPNLGMLAKTELLTWCHSRRTTHGIIRKVQGDIAYHLEADCVYNLQDATPRTTGDLVKDTRPWYACGTCCKGESHEGTGGRRLLCMQICANES